MGMIDAVVRARVGLLSAVNVTKVCKLSHMILDAHRILY